MDVILGHHPHVLQGIEEYRNGLIAYSLGNFLFDLWGEETKRSMILKVKLGKDGVTGFEIRPVYIEKNFQPVEAFDEKESEIRRTIKTATEMILKRKHKNKYAGI